MFRKKTDGFTLIELLVVIAIIGILSSVVIASLNSARKKGRDVARIQDIKSIQLALELYYDENGTYPTSTAPLATGNHIPVVPTDPGAGNVEYGYEQLNSGADYHLGASLETNGHSALSSDIDRVGTVIDGDDAGKCKAADVGSHCYDVQP